MDYIGQIFRPPSEAHSLLLQVTLGCSHNQCTFCNMYKDKAFKAKKIETIEADLKEASVFQHQIQRVFLMDGDALCLSQKKLMAILELIKHYLPSIERVSTYANTSSILRKTVEELKELKALKLSMVYHGAESGSDTVLKKIKKNATQKEHIEAARKLKEAEITHSVMVLLGLAEDKERLLHAEETGFLLTQMNPDYIAALTLMLAPNTELYEAYQKGQFKIASPLEVMEELKLILEKTEVENCRFSSNHASNYLPLRIQLPQDKQSTLLKLEKIILGLQKKTENLKPEWMRGL